MATKQDDTVTITTHRAPNPMGAVANARIRSADAVADNPQFFLSAEHQARVDEVYAIVDGWFRVKKGIYINQRANRGRPFSVVKVDGCQFPAVKPSVKEAAYTKPLADLGVEIVFSKATNSYLYRVY